MLINNNEQFIILAQSYELEPLKIKQENEAREKLAIEKENAIKEKYELLNTLNKQYNLNVSYDCIANKNLGEIAIYFNNLHLEKEKNNSEDIKIEETPIKHNFALIVNCSSEQIQTELKDFIATRYIIDAEFFDNNNYTITLF